MSEEGWSRVVDPRTLAIEEAIGEIERELARHLIRFSAVERIAIAAALERLGETWAWHGRKFEPW